MLILLSQIVVAIRLWISSDNDLDAVSHFMAPCSIVQACFLVIVCEILHFPWAMANGTRSKHYIPNDLYNSSSKWLLFDITTHGFIKPGQFSSCVAQCNDSRSNDALLKLDS
jgi:hypothetical protein